jgi:hypothetical protein
LFGPALPLVHHHTITRIEPKGTKFRRYHHPDLPVSCRRLELKDRWGIPTINNKIGYGINIIKKNIPSDSCTKSATIMQVQNMTINAIQENRYHHQNSALGERPLKSKYR